jgi:Tfp pilus assembly protein PilO
VLKLPGKLADLPGLPFRMQVLVVAGALTLLGLGGYVALVMPPQRELRTLKTQLVTPEPQADAAREPVPPITDEERKLWVQLEARLRERFPAEKDLPDALRGVAELARSAGMELVALNLHTPASKAPGAPSGAPSPAVSPVPRSIPPPLSLSPTTIKLTVNHRYRSLVEFLDGLPRLPVLVTVESLEMKRVENGLSTEITLRTLRWGSAEPR